MTNRKKRKVKKKLFYYPMKKNYATNKIINLEIIIKLIYKDIPNAWNPQKATGGFTLMCPSMIFAAPHYTSIFIHSGCCPHISVTIVCKYIVTCFATFFSGLKSSSLCYGTWSFCWIHYWSIYSKIFFYTLVWDFFLGDHYGQIKVFIGTNLIKLSLD